MNRHLYEFVMSSPTKMFLNRLLSPVLLAGVMFAVLIVSLIACDVGASPVAPRAESTVAPGAESTVAPRAESTVAPGAESTVAPGAESTAVSQATRFQLVDFHYLHSFFYLVHYQREANATRNGWDIVNASFFIYVEGDYPPPEVLTSSPEVHIVELAGTRSLFNLRLVWDGGHGGKVVPMNEVGSPLIPFELKFRAEVPTVVETVWFEVQSKEKDKLWAVDGKSGLRSTDKSAPIVWTPAALATEYWQVVGSDVLITSMDDESNELVRYVDLGQAIDGDILAWEVEVENLSKQVDMDATFCIKPKGFVDALGRLIAEGTEESCFDWEESLVPPGFKSRGVLELPLPENVDQASYLIARLRLAGMTDFEPGSRLIKLPR